MSNSHTYTHERLVIGADGGGSKCDVMLLDECGNVLGWGRGGSTAAMYCGMEAALACYTDAVHQAMGDYRPRELWIAGMLVSEFEAAGMEVPIKHEIPAHEMSMGLAMAMEPYGILVLSGTGSFVYARTETGEDVHLDSLGPVLGDHGSGYQIGLNGIRAACAANFSPRRTTILKDMVPKEMGVERPMDIYDLVYHQQIGRRTIATAGKAVVEAAEMGDGIAREIILEAANDISEVLYDVIDRLGAADKDYALVASGGIAQNSPLFWSRVCERAYEIAPKLRPIQPKIKPCGGAALLALKAIGVPWTKDLLERIEQTQERFK